MFPFIPVLCSQHIVYTQCIVQCYCKCGCPRFSVVCLIGALWEIFRNGTAGSCVNSMPILFCVIIPELEYQFRSLQVINAKWVTNCTFSQLYLFLSFRTVFSYSHTLYSSLYQSVQPKLQYIHIKAQWLSTICSYIHYKCSSQT